MTRIALNDLIERDGLDPRRTLVMRHTPGGRFRRALPFIVGTAPDLFAVYEAAQSNAGVIASFRACTHALSFLGDENGQNIFIGAFAIGEGREMDRREYNRDPRWQRLHTEFGLDADGYHDPDQTHVLFGHTPRETWRHLSGRLRIDWPGGTRSWCRRAHSNDFTVTAIAAESDFAEGIPSPEALTLRAPELAVLPPSWRTALSQWRGIYLITVEEEGARYVGSAYGTENLFGRWSAHVAGDHGVTKELATRPTSAFRFSILELLAPDAPMKDVIARERRWMDRLHTIEYGLNT